MSTASDQPTHRAPLPTSRGVSQLAMINDDFAQYCAEIYSIPTCFIAQMVRRAHTDGYCADDEVCIATLANIFYRAIYYKEGS